MSKLPDSPVEFKLINGEDQVKISKRNIGIFSMVLNRLNLPARLHEFVFGVYVAGNFIDNTSPDEMSLMRIARSLTSDPVVQLKVYNRLKQNSPKFFEWQDKQTFSIIGREILKENSQRHKTKVRYWFLIHDAIAHLFNLPKELSQRYLRAEVDRIFKDIPKEEKPKRKPRAKKAKSVAKALMRNSKELLELVGSSEVAALYVIEQKLSDEDFQNLLSLAEALLQSKDLGVFLESSQ